MVRQLLVRRGAVQLYQHRVVLSTSLRRRRSHRSLRRAQMSYRPSRCRRSCGRCRRRHFRTALSQLQIPVRSAQVQLHAAAPYRSRYMLLIAARRHLKRKIRLQIIIVRGIRRHRKVRVLGNRQSKAARAVHNIYVAQRSSRRHFHIAIAGFNVQGRRWPASAQYFSNASQSVAVLPSGLLSGRRSPASVRRRASANQSTYLSNESGSRAPICSRCVSPKNSPSSTACPLISDSVTSSAWPFRKPAPRSHGLKSLRCSCAVNVARNVVKLHVALLIGHVRVVLQPLHRHISVLSVDRKKALSGMASVRSTDDPPRDGTVMVDPIPTP